MRPALPLLASILCLAAGCRGAIPVAGDEDPPTREEMERRRSSPFGIEYAFPVRGGSAQSPEVAERFRGIGARWVKFQGVGWAGIEPHRPREGRHDYRFETLDRYVLAWQRAGFHVQMHLMASSPWAGSEGTGPATEGFGWKVIEIFARPSTVPRDEYLDDYGTFVEAVVERYDGDGIADLPGLMAPILDYEIESEVQHLPFWASSVEDYRRMLGVAYAAAHRAAGSARVLLSGIHVGEFVADDPPDDVLEARFRKATEGLPAAGAGLAERVRLFLPSILTFTDRYDAVEFHCLEDTAEAIPGTVRWIRRQMGEGGREKPIWAGDATSALEAADPIGLSSGGGLSLEDRKRVRNAHRNPFFVGRDRVIAWFRAEQASLAVKKAVVAVASGCERIFLASLEDWPGSPWAFHGLADQKGDPKPVFHALALLFGALEGYDRVEAVDLGAADVRAFRFARANSDVVVAWTDDGVLQTWESAPAAPRGVRIPLAGTDGRWTPIPTGEDVGARWTRIAAGQDSVELQIGETPILVEIAR